MTDLGHPAWSSGRTSLGCAGGESSGPPLVAMTTSEPTVLLAQPEAARLLGVERTTIWRMCRRGELRLVHIGRRALVTRESLDDFVRSQVQSG